MDDPGPSQEEPLNAPGILALADSWAHMGMLRRLSSLTALLVYALTPVAVFVVLGVRLAGLVPFWLCGTMAALLFPVPGLLISFEEKSLLPHPGITWIFDYPRQALRLSLSTASSAFTISFGYYALLHWTATSLPLAVQAMIFCSFASLLPVFLLESGRRWALKFWARAEGPYAALGLLPGLIVTLTSLFSSFTYVLRSHHVIQLQVVSGTQPTVDNISMFYLWHFLNSVPLLDVTSTLRWTNPIEYQDVGTGALVLCYKAAVIVPITAMLVVFWRETTRKSTEGKTR